MNSLPATMKLALKRDWARLATRTHTKPRGAFTDRASHQTNREVHGLEFPEMAE
jgi:hypothetical protein